jgi:hypothetical protein
VNYVEARLNIFVSCYVSLQASPSRRSDKCVLAIFCVLSCSYLNHSPYILVCPASSQKTATYPPGSIAMKSGEFFYFLCLVQLTVLFKHSSTLISSMASWNYSLISEQWRDRYWPILWGRDPSCNLFLGLENYFP